MDRGIGRGWKEKKLERFSNYPVIIMANYHKSSPGKGARFFQFQLISANEASIKVLSTL